MKRAQIILVFLAISTSVFSQTPLEFDLTSNRGFIENKGQFINRNWKKDEVKYAINENPFYIFFTNKGLTYRFDKIIKNPEYRKEDPTSHKRVNISELIHATWIGANENVEIKAEEKNSNYYSYAVRTGVGKETKNIPGISGYQKITYINLYDNIDVEYVIHPAGGIKYSIILHPGADPTQVKLKYSSAHTDTKDEHISYGLNDQGQFEIKTSLASILEKKPFTFESLTENEIPSKFKFENDVLTFDLENYDNTKEVIIDPWVISPTFTTSSAVWEVETDGIGNIYSIGGETPMELRKYTAGGALTWTYVTPWDTNSVWLGTMATDDAGTSYVTSGTSPEIERVDNAGNMVWHTNGGGFSTEYWSITFNCDKTKLIVGGTGATGIFGPFEARIYDMDVTNGNVLNTQVVGQQGGGFTPVEVRSISSSKNAKYIYLTHNQVGAINQNIGACPTDDPYFELDNGHHLAYKCENYLPETQNGGGLKALVANDNYFYTHAGDEIHQRDLGTGALINSAPIPGGNSNTVLGDLVVHNSGLAVDDCGNVYAGADDRIVKFDENLNFLAETITNFSVYDVSVNSNGEVIAVGAEQDNGSTNRNGKMQSAGLGACAQYALVCCDANICPQDTLCETDAAINLFTTTGGGTFSGTGITDVNAGTFDPAVSGSGVFTVQYTLTCGTDEIDVIVSPCTNLEACVETNGDITITNGTGPYTWEEETITQDCGACIIGCNFPAGCAVDVTSWTFYANGTTITPPSFPLQVTDNVGSTIIITDPNLLPNCSVTACDATISAAGPFCIDDAAVNLTAVDAGGTWSGTGITDANAGTFDPATAGAGTHTITYTLVCGDSDTEDIIVNALDDASFTYPAASYCVTDADPTPTITGVAGGTFSIDNGGTINAGTGVIDLDASGTGTYNITYTTTGTCPNSAVFAVTITAGADATITAAGPFCATDAAVNLVAVDGGGVWAGTGITDTNLGTFDPATAGAGTHNITYTISGGCGDVDDIDITVNAADDATFNYTAGSYCLTDPNPTPTVTGLAGGTFTINNGGTINATTGEIDITASGAGTYDITYTTNGPCPTFTTVQVVLTSGADATITAAGPFCATDAAVNLVAVDGGGVWAGTGITDVNLGTFDPATAGAGTHNITYTISGGCGDADNIDITVNAADDATYNYTAGSYCITDPNPTPSVTGLAGGTFTINNGGTINATTGEIDITASGAGTYDITYTTNGPCPTFTTVQVVLTSGADATITAAGPFCATDAAVNLVAVDGGGVWAGTGITDVNLGTFDPATAGAGTHNITYTISGGCGDADNIDITVNAADDATFNYTAGSYCLTDPNPTPTVTGLAGGTFTINNGGTINATTGEIDIAASGAGTYDITYTTNGPCPTFTTVQVVLTSGADATITAAGPFCENDAAVNLLAADAGGTWTGTGITDANTGTFDPATAGAGTHTITYTIGGGCGDTDNIDIVVSPSDNASFSYAAASFCTMDTDPSATISGTAGGTFTMDNGGVINSSTGEIDLDATGVGTYTVTYTTNGACPASSTFNITISDGGSASINPAGPYCLYDSNDILNASQPGGTWSGTGIVDPATGEFSPGTAGVGIHTITYTTTGTCGVVATFDITVNDIPTADIDGPFWINWGEDVEMTATGGTSYIWTPDEYLSCNDCANPTASPIESTQYCVIAIDNGCTDTACVQVLVNLDCGDVFVPNIFTPNSDDENSLECVIGGCLTQVHMRIYDRWGELVFETFSKDECWDGTHMRNGKPMSTAVFVYVLTATTAQGEKLEQNGNITLVR